MTCGKCANKCNNCSNYIDKTIGLLELLECEQELLGAELDCALDHQEYANNLIEEATCMLTDNNKGVPSNIKAIQNAIDELQNQLDALKVNLVDVVDELVKADEAQTAAIENIKIAQEKNSEIGCLIDEVQISFFDTVECLMHKPTPEPKPCPQPKPCHCKHKGHCDCDC